jgi:nucleotide-binding universal stress UspA family protein
MPMPVPMEGSMSADIDPQYYRELLNGVRKRLEGADLKYPVETRCLQGFEPESIVQVAAAVGCSLIVMGSHGRTALGRLLMGSVAESVLAKADCPVMVVKSPHPAAPSSSGHPEEQKSLAVS